MISRERANSDQGVEAERSPTEEKENDGDDP